MEVEETKRLASRRKHKEASLVGPTPPHLLSVRGRVTQWGRASSQSPQRINHAIIRAIMNLLHGNARPSCLPNSLSQETAGSTGKELRPRKLRSSGSCAAPRPRKAWSSQTVLPQVIQFSQLLGRSLLPLSWIRSAFSYLSLSCPQALSFVTDIVEASTGVRCD